MDSDDEDYAQYEVKQGIAFLVELTPLVFHEVEQLGRSQLEEVLQAIADLMSDMIITASHNGVGIYFYHCGKTSSKFKAGLGINKLFRLNDLNASNMKLLNDVLEDGLDNLREKFPPTTKLKDTDVVTTLRTLITEFQAKRYTHKRLVWVTDNERPYRADDVKLSLRSFVSDFEQFNIDISPVFLGQTFDTSLYKDIFLNTPFLKDNVDVSLLHDTILRQREVNRIHFACDLVLSDGNGKLGCSVRGYTLYNHEKVKRSKNLYNKGESLKVVYAETAELSVRKGWRVRATRDGGDVVFHFSDEQVEFMRGAGFDHAPNGVVENVVGDSFDGDDGLSFSKPPYLKLLGFMEGTAHHPITLGPPTFVTANINNPLGYLNLFATFAALHAACVRLGQYAVVFGCIKRNARPALYAMHPNAEPEGFLLVKRPWQNELRSLPEYYLEDEHQVEDPLVEAFKMMASDYYLKAYDPHEFPNPSLNYFYKVIRNELLQVEMDSDSLHDNDALYRRVEQLRKHLEESGKTDLLDKINTYLQKWAKRPAPPAGGTAKRSKPDVDPAAVVSAWENHAWGSLTVPQLKQFAQQYPEIAKASRKQDIIDNISAFLESRQGRL